MRVYIAEKPSLAEKIAEGIGKHEKTKDCFFCENGDKVTWCYGHMLEQAAPGEYGEQFKTWRMSSLPVIPERWKLTPKKKSEKYEARANEFIDKSNAHLKSIVAMVSDPKVSEIVHAGDPDREGQLIVDEILEYFSIKKPVKRIWLKALDPGTVKKAIAGLEDNALKKYKGLMNSALARGRADWLVGMNMTRAVSLSSGQSSVMTVGRVQTPVLRLVHDRNEAIRNFVPKDFFIPTLDIEGEGQKKATLEWVSRLIEGVTDEEKRILRRSDAEALSKALMGQTVPLSVTKETKKIAPPLPWSLSTLQVFAGKELGLSPQKVLDTVQSLYDDGYLSYPRTDCEYLPTSIHPDAVQILPPLVRALGKVLLPETSSRLDASRKSKAFDDSKVTAHYAITPTPKVPSLSFLKPDQARIYEIVSLVYLAQFAPEAQIAETKMFLKNDQETFRISGKVILDKGWMEVWNHGGPKSDKVLPNFANGDAVKVVAVGVRAGKTTPPDPFTESNIIDVMKSVHKYIEDKSLKSILKESDGIGTEATRSGIVENLLTRGLLKTSGDKKTPILSVTEKGKDLLRVVPSEVSDPVMTALWERTLAEIERSEKSVDDFVSEVGKKVDQWVEKLKATMPAEVSVPCPKCGKPVSRRTKENRAFWVHVDRSHADDCVQFLSDDKGSPVVSGSVSSDPPVPCPKCGKPVSRRTKENRAFWVHVDRSHADNWVQFLSDSDGKPVAQVQETSLRSGPPCPRCAKHPNMLTLKTSKGTEYYKCPDCQVKFWTGEAGEYGKPWEESSSWKSSAGKGKAVSSGRRRS